MRKQTTAINIDSFEDRWKQLGKFSVNFSSCNSFPSWPSAAKDTCEKFRGTNIAIVNKNRPLFVGFLLHKYIFWLFKDMLIIRDRAP